MKPGLKTSRIKQSTALRDHCFSNTHILKSFYTLEPSFKDHLL